MILLGLQNCSLIDFPGKLSAVVFIPGCNFRCPYCHNPEFVSRKEYSSIRGGDGYRIEDILAFFKKRRGLIEGIVFSGGEPLLAPELPDLVSAAKDCGFSVKIDTNGSDPEKLIDLKPDFVAVDIKTSPGKYRELPYFGGERGWFTALATLKALGENALSHESRTTLVPGIVGPEELSEIVEALFEDEYYVLNRFRPGRTLDPSHSSLAPYTENELEEMLAIAKHKLPRAKLR